MKLKNYWNWFWTLDRHHAAGFTLVELIVVIAILAILAGVGIPVYSGYITKANKQADITLASEVEHALTLAHYAGTLPENGYVILTANGAPTVAGKTISDTVVENALKAAFGDSLDGLVLKHDDWGTSAKMLTQASKNPNADTVNSSSYLTNVGTKELLGDVQNCVTALNGLFGNLYESGDVSDLVDDLRPEYKNVLINAGYEAGEDNSWEGVDSTVLTNAIVFGLASEYVGDNGTSIGQQFYNTDDPLLFVPIESDTGIAELAAWYASAEAYVAWANDSSLNQAFSAVEQYLAKPNQITSADAVRAQMNTLQGAILNYAAADEDHLAYFEGVSGGKSQAQLDGEAYVNIMRTVNDLSGDYKNSLTENALFTEGAVLNQVDNYVAATVLVAALPEDVIANLGSSWVAVMIVDGEIQCLPVM